VACLEALGEKSHLLKAEAVAVGLHLLARACAALEAFLKDLCEKPQLLTMSAMQTVAQAIDLLTQLATLPPEIHAARLDQPFEVLVVDDDEICRLAAVRALERSGFKAVSYGNPQEALNFLNQSPVALVVADVVMPGLDGYELCACLRAAATHRHTPIIFATSQSDLQGRSKSALSGGDDLIAKPFLFTELALKALTYACKSLPRPRGPADPPQPRIERPPAAAPEREKSESQPCVSAGAPAPSQALTAEIEQLKSELLLEKRLRLEADKSAKAASDQAVELGDRLRQQEKEADAAAAARDDAIKWVEAVVGEVTEAKAQLEAERAGRQEIEIKAARLARANAELEEKLAALSQKIPTIQREHPAQADQISRLDGR
jgi:PleD family two-component response regulator